MKHCMVIDDRLGDLSRTSAVQKCQRTEVLAQIPPTQTALHTCFSLLSTVFFPLLLGHSNDLCLSQFHHLIFSVVAPHLIRVFGYSTGRWNGWAEYV